MLSDDDGDGSIDEDFSLGPRGKKLWKIKNLENDNENIFGNWQSWK